MSSGRRFDAVRRSGAAAAAVVLVLAGLGAGTAAADPGNGNSEAANRPEVLMVPRGAASHKPRSTNNLLYGGGIGGVGVLTGQHKVYLVYWGSQWNGNDPSGQAAIQQNFFQGVGGSSWNASVTQYCQGIAINSSTCGSGSTFATNPTGVLGGIWYDNASPAPAQPTQAQLAAEAVRAAQYFGRTTALSNTSAQYVINTATGNNSSGFGTQYCAWHSYTSSAYGNIAYTNMPYMTDAGGSCGANINGLGPTAGITIVGGHEFAETETDPFPGGGWMDQRGAENADKCAWITSGQGAIVAITLGSQSFAVQSLWSNAFNTGNGGCVQSYP
jgi:serine protease